MHGFRNVLGEELDDPHLRRVIPPGDLKILRLHEVECDDAWFGADEGGCGGSLDEDLFDWGIARDLAM